MAAAKKAASVAQKVQQQQQVQQRKGMFRWPMSAEARNSKKAACCYVRCKYCGELVVDTYMVTNSNISAHVLWLMCSSSSV